MSKNPRKTLINKLQKAVNYYVRLRDCKGKGGCNCIACRGWFYFNDLDAGHFIPSTHSALRYDLRNINAECQKCNRFLHGNLGHYYEGMIKKYGQDIVDELYSKENEIKKWEIWELKEKLLEVKKLTDELY